MRILIVDDHCLFREATGLILERLTDRVTLIEAGDAEEALRLVEHYRELDLILLDLALPGCGGLEAIERILAIAPGTPIAVLSGSEDPRRVTAAIDAGACGFIPKSASSHEFISALRIVLDGEIYLPPRYLHAPLADTCTDAAANAAANAATSPAANAATSAATAVTATIATAADSNGDAASGERTAAATGAYLTARQQRVLELLAEGLPNKLIARELSLSDATVKLHVSAILRELGVRNRTEAVVLATQRGLLQPRAQP